MRTRKALIVCGLLLVLALFSAWVIPAPGSENGRPIAATASGMGSPSADHGAWSAPGAATLLPASSARLAPPVASTDPVAAPTIAVAHRPPARRFSRPHDPPYLHTFALLI